MWCCPGGSPWSLLKGRIIHPSGCPRALGVVESPQHKSLGTSVRLEAGGHVVAIGVQMVACIFVVCSW